MILIERASTMNEKQQKALLKALGNHSYSWIPDGSDEKTMRDLLQAAEASPVPASMRQVTRMPIPAQTKLLRTR
ncbi:hypothetical protein [Allobaculum sp. Allo2]|uniref:hypothetical protein n=1 Tax=Allobaculum sp. Allo2 TaxID=2853432 RepID=UPI001F61691F|nr:hypothetical protein [Allobaculum sp. Allo2]UNT93233.1 hypothetical protein KWG61_14830 [Allobaculum sp. Allo2]